MSDTIKYIKEYKFIEKIGRKFLSVGEKAQIINDYERIVKENETLKQTIATLTQENVIMKQTIANQKQTIATLTQENAIMKQIIVSQEKIITIQKKIIATMNQIVATHTQRIIALMTEINKLRALLNIPPSSENVEDISNS